MAQKNFKPAIKSYILDCLRDEDHGLENPTDSQLWVYCKNRINSEYDYMVARVGMQNAIREWLLGLAINCEYTYFEIENLLHKWGILEGQVSDRRLERELEDYWSRLAVTIALEIKKV